MTFLLIKRVFIGEVYLQLQRTLKWPITSFINVLNIQRTAETFKVNVLRPTLAEYTLSSQMDLKNHLRCLQQRRWWRRLDATFPSICPTNMIYGTCTCQATCEDPNGQSGCNSDCLGTEGCTCPAGFLCKGVTASVRVNAGCFVTEANLVIPDGETFVNDDCTQKCSCINNQLICEDYRCSTNAVCDVRNEIRQCYCNEGLKVFQRSTDGSTSFDQDWDAYKNGFGDIRNLWLGNEKLHYLTNQRNYKLRFDITTSSGSAKYAEYTEFQVESESSNYTMNKLGTRSGNT
ncbi:putative fibrinogen-like protein 1 isoform X2, partial [Apostichopus japonicus]